MDTTFQINGIIFVWDTNKAIANLAKQGVRFEQAAEAFFDPFLKVVDASRQGEAREAILALDRRWHLLFVVHMEITEESIRLISARHATKQERAFYET